MNKTFYSWLLQFKDDDTAIGDLSRDVRCDKEFPRRAISYRHLKDYFESKHACLRNTKQRMWPEHRERQCVRIH